MRVVSEMRKYRGMMDGWTTDEEKRECNKAKEEKYIKYGV